MWLVWFASAIFPEEVPAASERTEQLPAELLERDEAAAL